jgi:membrane protease YdiL (CAAX protease family)
MMCRRTGTIVVLLAAGAVATGAAAQGAGDAGASESTAAAAEVSWWWLSSWCALAVAAVVAVRRVAWFRQMPRIGPAWPLRAEASILGFGAAFMSAALGATLLARALPDSGSELARVTLQAAGGHTAQLAVVAVLFSISSARPRRGLTAVGHGGVHAQPRGQLESVALGACFAALLWPMAQAVGGIATALQALAGARVPELGHRTLEALAAAGPSDPWWWASVGCASLLTPLAEEWMYRGLLQQGLKGAGLGRGAAIAVTSVLFALVHWGSLAEDSRVAGMATLVLLSVGWGMLYERSGRIAAPIVAHALFNAANLWIAA